MLHRKRPGKEKEHYPLIKHIRNLLIIAAATFAGTISYQIFIEPNSLLPGGVWGFAAILHYFFPIIPMGIYVAALNLPLLLWGWSKLKIRFALYTVFAVVLQSVSLLVLEGHLPVYSNNILLACIFGGVFGGTCGGFVVKFHGSGGGTDIIGIILKSKFDISVGNISLIVNACVVLLASFIHGFEPAMYTMVYLYVSSTIFTQVLEGMNRKRNMMIVTDQGHEIADRLISELGRSVTLLKGEGGYTHREKDVLFCVVSRFELSALKEIIHKMDPHAFVCINRTYEVLGRFPQKAELEKQIKDAQKKKVEEQMMMTTQLRKENLLQDEYFSQILEVTNDRDDS